MDPENELKIIKYNTVHLETLNDLKNRLASKKKLRIKWGIDPTSPDIHLGHTVVINKINDFLKLGHEVVIIIGDFTAMIGDPTGRSKTRPRLTREEVEDNAQTYLNQIKKILTDGNLIIRRNSEWIDKLTMTDLISHMSKFTVARLLERDDFSKRFKNNEPIFLHEPLYVLMQAYDSVAIRPDIEIGGTDQLFNLLAGRELMKDCGLEQQLCLTMPLLTGTDGKLKMSKSYNNHIGIAEDAFTIFSKTMSIPDGLITDYFKLVLAYTPEEINKKLAGDPKGLKMRLGQCLAAKLHNESAASAAKERWEQIFSKKQYPDPEKEIIIQKSDLNTDSQIWIVDLVYKTGLFRSKGEARRIISQGGIEINHQKKNDVTSNIAVDVNTVIKVGKKNQFFKIKIT